MKFQITKTRTCGVATNSATVKVYIQRSTDGRILYFRPGPNKRWDIMVDQEHGSVYMFTELKPGDGRFYTITPAKA